MTLPANSWLFDLEILKAIPEKGKQRDWRFQYCKHWGDHEGMGISVLAAAKPDLSFHRVFVPDFCPYDGKREILDREPMHHSLLPQFFQSCDMVIGYNSRFFDYKVLAAQGIHIPVYKHLDILFEIKKKLRQAAPKGYKMEALSQRCGGPGKTEDGAQAPILWQMGEKQRVIDYCCNDLAMLSAIVQFYAMNDYCVPTPEGLRLRLRSPLQITQEDRV
jgi:hypothetical protein